MKTTLPRQDLQDALAAASSLTSGRTTKPILNCVKLDVTAEQVEVSATDGEAGLRLTVPVLSVERPGETVVQADKFLRIVREMTDAEIVLEADDRYCTIRGAGSKFNVFVTNPSDFPPVPRFADEGDIVVGGETLKRMVAMTLYAAARETSRYAINGVLWSKQGKKLFLVATDGRRLARAGGIIKQASSSDFEVIVPAKALTVFERVFSAPRDEQEAWQIDVKFTPNQILLRSGERVLSTVLVEGSFPKYEDVIPKSASATATLDRTEFYSAIKRAEILTTEDSRAVRLSFEKDTLVLTSQAPDQGDARVEMPIQFDGNPIDIGFNPNFLNDALKAVPFYEQVKFEMTEPSRPGVLIGEDKTDFLYVIMPVSLGA